MAITQKDINQIQSIVSPLLGRKAWGVSLGIGSFITLEFGEPLQVMAVETRVHGEWHLWIQYCDWYLKDKGMVIVHSSSDRAVIKQSIRQLEGIALHSVIVSPDTSETTFAFEQEFNLSLSSTQDQNNVDLWWLFTPDGNVLRLSRTDWSFKSSKDPS